MYHITIRLPKDRERPGVLILGSSPRTAGDLPLLPPMVCRGKADNAKAAAHGNPARDPVKPYGDTPAGVFARTRVERLTPPSERMGVAWIPLVGTEGQALLAMQMGREGLGIHAGRGDLELMATYGCVRLYSKDFALLCQRLGKDDVEVTIEEVE